MMVEAAEVIDVITTMILMRICAETTGTVRAVLAFIGEYKGKACEGMIDEMIEGRVAAAIDDRIRMSLWWLTIVEESSGGMIDKNLILLL
mmetsp:Transcript_22366/g.19089  ORF Transcript_22366/g.19089 Transcript_22366/m.19089 type:complete len:90 (+) Transcript_22366:63-332(+)